MNARATVGGWWSFVQDEARRTLTSGDTPLKRVVVFPQGEDFFLDLREIDPAIYWLEHGKLPLGYYKLFICGFLVFIR